MTLYHGSTLWILTRQQGKMKIGHFEAKSEQQLDWWYSTVADYLQEKNMIETPDCSYALFVREKLPLAWKKYILRVT